MSDPSTGLHGGDIRANMLRAGTAELIGAIALVFTGDAVAGSGALGPGDDVVELQRGASGPTGAHHKMRRPGPQHLSTTVRSRAARSSFRAH